MADPRFVVPYRDPYDTPLSPSIFNLTNPTISDLSNNVNNNYNGLVPLPQQIEYGDGNGVQGVNHPLLDPMMSNYYFPNGGNGNNNNFESQVNVGPSQPPNWNFLGLQNFSNMEVMSLPCWPDSPSPFSCSCCQVLREIIHTNGFTFNKLEIDGRLGIMCHAIHHQNINGNINGASSSNPQFQMIDFTMKNIQEIKNFLVQYCLGQNTSGYVMVQDPLSSYYEALCIGLDWAEDLNDYIDMNPNGSGGPSDEMEQEVDNGRARRPSLSEQGRKRDIGSLKECKDDEYLEYKLGALVRWSKWLLCEKNVIDSSRGISLLQMQGTGAHLAQKIMGKVEVFCRVEDID
ncbi:hypothetical protein TanjilG_01770 [Lupinus angustifolius]|uniref:Uncharacterized protein n=1 Tax=Lupinus angustifolius TaxID=3871 RepID=A0A1J7GZU1_LUPAN|nr:hypothetical protein TanjilG_01770 [Lupinus angustifolius]